MKISYKTIATAMAASMLVSPNAFADKKDNRNQPKIEGVYYGLTEILTLTGSFGTVSCLDANPGDPDACEFYSALHLKSDGTATTLISPTSDIAQPQIIWHRTGRRTVEFRSSTIQYNGDGDALNWSIATGEIFFDRGFKTYTSDIEINRYPITEDPSQPSVPPVLTIVTRATATLLE